MLPVTHRNWAELCLGISCGGTGQQWTATGTGVVGAADLVWDKPSWRRSPLTPPQSCQNLHNLGNRLLEGTNRTLCAPEPRKKEQWSNKRLTQTCLWVSRSLQWRRGSVVACCRVRGSDSSSACMGSFEGHHYLHYLHHSLAPGKQQGSNTAPPINRKLA